MADTRVVLDDIVTEVTDQYHREIEHPPAGEHLWTFLGVFQVQLSDIDQAGKASLGSLNLLSFEGPGCLVCEQIWSEEVADAPCPGEASEAGD